MNLKEFFKHENLDEMQKQTLLKIESRGFCLLWVLLTFVKEVMRGVIPDTLISSNQVESLGWIIVGVALMCLVIFRPQGLLGDRKELAFNA